MIKKHQLIPFIVLLVIWTGCTNTKDGFSYRVFHNTTAKFNGFFYAEESMKEARQILDKDYKENYDEILPVFVYGDTETAQSIYPQMERVIEKSQKVIKRHNLDIKGRAKKKMKRPEMNKWIDDNYLLLGQGYFYKNEYFKAAEFFKYIPKKYKDPEVVAEAHNWLARVHLEAEDWNKVKVNLQKAEKGELSDATKADTEMIYADYFIRKKEYRKAIDHLTKGIALIKKKKDRARPTFILAQLNQQIGESQRAIDLYETVLDLKPKYELEFYAQINQAMAYNRRNGNSTEIKEKLSKMLRDDKNLEYRDQIYYALADLAFEEQNVEMGIDYLHKSLDAYVDNDKQKGKTFVRLADRYFDEKDYSPAKIYYDSTLVKINEEHDRFEEIKVRAESLTDLINNLALINKVSDDIKICNADAKDVDKLLKERQDKLQAEVDEKIRLAQLALESANSGDEEGTGQFWPYNPLLKNKGKENFISYWGERKLEDNWRRKYKAATFTDTEENVDNNDETASPDLNDDFYVPSIEELKADLPCGSSDMSAVVKSMARAYYDNGLIYKEKLNDFEPGIESWETLVRDLDDSEVHDMAFYQLYRSYYNKEQNGYSSFGCETCSSKHWADIIRSRYPGSEWERLVDNPNYLEGKGQKYEEELAAYKAIYTKYSQRDYISVITESGAIIENEKDNHLLCKHQLLRAQAIGYMDGRVNQRSNYIEALQAITVECKDTDEAKAAQEILAGIDGNVDDSKVEIEKDPKEEAVSLDDSPFTDEPLVRHYFAILVPLEGEPEIPFNKMKSNVNDYLKIYHKTEGRKVTSNLFGKEYQILLVKTFKTAEKALAFKEVFMSNDKEEKLNGINNAGHEVFVVSKNNYLTIFKKRNLSDYVAWQKVTYQ